MIKALLPCVVFGDSGDGFEHLQSIAKRAIAVRLLGIFECSRFVHSTTLCVHKEFAV